MKSEQAVFDLHGGQEAPRLVPLAALAARGAAAVLGDPGSRRKGQDG
jgi:hypothetical protein